MAAGVLPFPDGGPGPRPEDAIGGTRIVPQGVQGLLREDALVTGQAIPLPVPSPSLVCLLPEGRFRFPTRCPCRRPGLCIRNRRCCNRRRRPLLTSATPALPPVRGSCRVSPGHCRASLSPAPRNSSGPCEFNAVPPAARETGGYRFCVGRIPGREVPCEPVCHTVCLVGLPLNDDAVGVLRRGGCRDEKRRSCQRCGDESCSRSVTVEHETSFGKFPGRSPDATLCPEVDEIVAVVNE